MIYFVSETKKSKIIHVKYRLLKYRQVVEIAKDDKVNGEKF